MSNYLNGENKVSLVLICAYLLVLVVAVLPLAHGGEPLRHSLADLVRPGAAAGHNHGPGGVVAAGGGGAVALGLLTVGIVAVRVLAIGVLAVGV